MIRIAVDANGGDYGVNTTVPAAMEAVKNFKDIEIVLYGDEEKILQAIKYLEDNGVLVEKEGGIC